MKGWPARFWTQILVGAVIQGAVQALVQIGIERRERKSRRRAATNE